MKNDGHFFSLSAKVAKAIAACGLSIVGAAGRRLLSRLPGWISFSYSISTSASGITSRHPELGDYLETIQLFSERYRMGFHTQEPERHREYGHCEVLVGKRVGRTVYFDALHRRLVIVNPPSRPIPKFVIQKIERLASERTEPVGPQIVYALPSPDAQPSQLQARGVQDNRTQTVVDGPLEESMAIAYDLLK